MSDTDPHIHVSRKVVEAGAAVRNVIASAFGLVSDAPSVVTTGCGQRVPYAMTSHRPESVTCLPCREHAHREHLRFAAEIELLAGMPGLAVAPDEAGKAAQRHRELATRFAT